MEKVYVLDPQKISESVEFSVSLFDNCNLNCGFCFSKHKHFNIDPKSIEKVVPVCIDYLKNNINMKGKTDVVINTWGGELFADSVKDEMFEAYYKYYINFHDELMKIDPTLDVQLKFLSNGVFTKRERVKNLLDKLGEFIRKNHEHHVHIKHPVKIGFSYDPVGRFNTIQQKELWWENVQYFQPYFSSISITLTKPNIDLFIKGDEYFSKCKDLSIDENYYWANSDWEKYMPSDDDYFNFYKWVVDNRINCSIVKQAVESTFNPQRYCSCENTIQYIGGTCTRNCVLRTSNQNPEEFYGKYLSLANEKTCSEIKKNIYIEKRGCLDCEYFDFCTMGCVGSMCFSKFKQRECHLKRFYDYIKDKPEIIDWVKNTKRPEDD